MQEKKFMKSLYGILFCIFLATSTKIDANESWLDRINTWLPGAVIITCGTIFIYSMLPVDCSNENNAKDNDSYQAISVSRTDSNDDSVSENKILQPTRRQNGLPRIIIGSVVNKTPYNLAVVDVVNDWHFNVLAYKQVKLHDAVVENYKNIVVDGSLFNCLNGNAQIEIVEVNASGSRSQDNGAFLNMCIVSDNVAEGSLDFKFLMAGPNGGCSVSWDRLKNNQCQDVEVQLTLSVDPHDIKNNIFRIYGSYRIVEK